MDNNSRYTNPVAQATQDFGGQHRFALLMQSFGIQVHRQTVFNWVKAGSIPHQYDRAIRLVVKTHGRMLRDPQGLIQAIRSQQSLRGQVEAPNEPLEAFVKSQGGIAAMVKKVNELIKEQNISRDADGLPLYPKWTYVMIHNWLKRGRVSGAFQTRMVAIFDCPRAIMEMRPNAAEALTAPVPSASDILGE